MASIRLGKRNNAKGYELDWVLAVKVAAVPADSHIADTAYGNACST
jgi:hypothetical protein